MSENENPCPKVEPCGYTAKMSYQIMDKDGKVIDDTTWQNFAGVSWQAAYATKYATLSHIFEQKEGDTSPRIQTRVLDALRNSGAI